ncbi:MAG: hypothetical protein JWN14_4945, partial [Chthonomonadales bacterium]|nr:hypothetical protein [Chthonomonadales bacterium]
TRSFKENNGISEERTRALEKQLLASPDYAKMRQAAEAALAGVEQGNRAPHYVVLYYEPPFPALLKAAWYLDGKPFDPTFDTQDWQKISIATGAYIKSTVQEGDKAAAEHAAHILIDLGIKMAGDLLDKPVPLPKAEFMRLIVAFSMARQGYGYLLEAYNEAGDSVNAAQVDPEYNAFKEKYNQYMETALKALHNSYGEN